MPPDFPLALHTQWYTRSPPAFPVPSMLAHGPCTSTHAWTIAHDPQGRTRKTLICAVRFSATLATTTVRVEWDVADPEGTVHARQRHVAAPAGLSAAELRAAHEAYGRNLAAWVEGAVGSVVGDGECWALVQRGLLDLAEVYRRYGVEAPMGSLGRVHGVLLLVVEAAPLVRDGNRGLLRLADVRRGDVLEMTAAHFRIVVPEPESERNGRQEYGVWTRGAGEKNIRMAHHTAVVVGVEEDAVKVVEQNGSVPLGVGVETYDLNQMVRGEMRFYRVVGERWCQPLTAEWEE